MFLLRNKLITQGEKRETSTKTCNETMLRDKLRVFVSRISPPLIGIDSFTIIFLGSVSIKNIFSAHWSNRPQFETPRLSKISQQRFVFSSLLSRYSEMWSNTVSRASSFHSFIIIIIIIIIIMIYSHLF